MNLHICGLDQMLCLQGLVMLQGRVYNPGTCRLEHHEKTHGNERYDSSSAFKRGVQMSKSKQDILVVFIGTCGVFFYCWEI